jgi:endonuclease/exonuclease/phosphatase (EEP) superfamily protein YafD
MAFTRLASGACIANLHASTTDSKAAEEIGVAAVLAKEWAGGGPLLLGGDFNLRPRSSPLFAKLAEQGFSGPTAPDSLDHLLGHSLTVVEAPTPWPPEARELPWDGLSLRASDHAPIVGVFEA